MRGISFTVNTANTNTFDSDPKQANEKIHEILPNAEIVGELPLKDPYKNKEESEKKIAEWCQTLKQ
jgi:hypothetical protein